MSDSKDDSINPSSDQVMSSPSRREFLAAGAGSLALSLMDNCCLPATEKVGTHHIPEDKNLSKAWVDSLFAKGQSKVYKGEELTCIGMPIGGICAGQLYLLGDGRLGYWQIFNLPDFTGYGDNCYRTYPPPTPVEQGFEINYFPETGLPQVRGLDKKGFPKVEFVGEYPIARVRYVRAEDDPFPVEASLEAFSPFIPLNAKDSGIPGTILRFHFHNKSDHAVDVFLDGWLQNVIGS